MDKVAVNGSESGAKWATEGTYYWPAFQLDFYGYAPADAQGVTLNETTRTIADFTPAQKVEEQNNFPRIALRYGRSLCAGSFGNAVCLQHT